MNKADHRRQITPPKTEGSRNEAKDQREGEVVSGNVKTKIVDGLLSQHQRLCEDKATQAKTLDSIHLLAAEIIHTLVKEKIKVRLKDSTTDLVPDYWMLDFVRRHMSPNYRPRLIHKGACEEKLHDLC